MTILFRWCDGCRSRVDDKSFVDRWANFCEPCKDALAVRVADAEAHLSRAGQLDFGPGNEHEKRLHRERLKGKQYG